MHGPRESSGACLDVEVPGMRGWWGRGKSAERGKLYFISRFFPDHLLAGMLRAEHADSSLLGDDAFLVVSFLPGTSRPRASWREDTRSSRASEEI